MVLVLIVLFPLPFTFFDNQVHHMVEERWIPRGGRTISELNGIRLAHFGSSAIPAMVSEGHDASDKAKVLNLQCDHDTINEIREHAENMNLVVFLLLGQPTLERRL